MTERMVVKKVDGMWEIFPQAGWFARYFGFAQVKSTEKWLWITRFETFEEALQIANEVAKWDPLCFPFHLFKPRPDRRSQRIYNEHYRRFM